MNPGAAEQICNGFWPVVMPQIAVADPTQIPEIDEGLESGIWKA